MLKRIAFYFFVQLSLVTLGFCESLQLENDSIFTLTAVVIDANGNIIGGTQVPPHTTVTWQHDVSNKIMYENSSYVPFTVIWYCPEGKEYGVWTVATPGSRVSSQSSIGAKACKLKDPKKILEEAEKHQDIRNYSGEHIEETLNPD